MVAEPNARMNPDPSLMSIASMRPTCDNALVILSSSQSPLGAPVEWAPSFGEESAEWRLIKKQGNMGFHKKWQVPD